MSSRPEGEILYYRSIRSLPLVEMTVGLVGVHTSIPRFVNGTSLYHYSLFTAFLSRLNSKIISTINKPAPSVMAESAMLNVGK